MKSITIAVAVAEQGGEVRFLGTIPNQSTSVYKLIKKLNEGGPWAACYEAGPTGYALYWTMTKAGDRIKTDRRDALRLAQSFRSGDLTPVRVPDAAHEALRDLVRARHRLSKFLLRHGHRP